MDSHIVNLSALLAPISADNPTGLDVRQDPAPLTHYRQLKQARTTARSIERQLLQGTEQTIKADWKTVAHLCIHILTSQSKDIEVISWLIEAWLRLEGFAGLNAGFKLATHTIEQYWDGLYPLPDAEGLASRVAPLSGLNGEDIEGSLIAPMALTPLIPSNSATPVSLWHYQQARELLKITDKDKQTQRAASGTLTLAMIETAVKETPSHIIQAQLKNLQDCITSFTQLIHILMQKCGQEAPPSSRILSQLNACLECILTIGQSSLPVTVVTPPEETHQNHQEAASVKMVSSREQMLQNLLDAAQFFRSTEPHSPLPYILERAVRWGRMPLPDLLKELLHDDQAKKQLSHLTGIEFK